MYSRWSNLLTNSCGPSSTASGGELWALILPSAVRVLTDFTPAGFANLISVPVYITFLLRLMLAFGIIGLLAARAGTIPPVANLANLYESAEHDVLVIAEAPGYHEDRTGELLVGRAAGELVVAPVPVELVGPGAAVHLPRGQPGDARVGEEGEVREVHPVDRRLRPWSPARCDGRLAAPWR